MYDDQSTPPNRPPASPPTSAKGPVSPVVEEERGKYATFNEALDAQKKNIEAQGDKQLEKCKAPGVTDVAACRFPTERDVKKLSSVVEEFRGRSDALHKTIEEERSKPKPNQVMVDDLMAREGNLQELYYRSNQIGMAETLRLLHANDTDRAEGLVEIRKKYPPLTTEQGKKNINE